MEMNIYLGTIFKLAFISIASSHSEGKNCLAFESSYHLEKGCTCLIFESTGRSSGSFSSTNFPSPYPANVSCVLYTFIGEFDEIVSIHLHHLNLAQDEECADHLHLYVNIERPEVSDKQPPDHKLCGNLTSNNDKFYSSKRSLILEFHSGLQHENATGFMGSYKFIDSNDFAMKNGDLRWGSQCSYDFTSRKTVKEGVLFSPAYPRNYPVNCSCQYFFMGLKGEVILLTFSTIQLGTASGTESCSNNGDLLTFYDFHLEQKTSESPEAVELCGNEKSFGIVSSGERMTLTFTSDDVTSNTERGFVAMFHFINSTREDIDNSKTFLEILRKRSKNRRKDSTNQRSHEFVVVTSHGVVRPAFESAEHLKEVDNKGNAIHQRSIHLPLSDDIPTSPLISEFRACPSGGQVVVDVRQGGVATEGFILSPSHTIQHPMNCTYVIISRINERIRLEFLEFILHSGNSRGTEDNQNCEDEESDTLRVATYPYESSPISFQSTADDLGGPYCGHQKPPTMMSSRNKMAVLVMLRSHSKSADILRRFRLKYTFVTDFGIKAGVQDESQDCKFTFQSSQASTHGSFNSPNFPGLYPRDSQCYFRFRSNPGERVYISFVYFDVDGVPPKCDNETQSDHVDLYDTDATFTAFSDVQRRLCGSQLSYQNAHLFKSSSSSASVSQKTFSSSGQFLGVDFHSNHVFDGHGFKAKYQFKKIAEGASNKQILKMKKPDPSRILMKPLSSSSPSLATAVVQHLATFPAICLHWRTLFINIFIDAPLSAEESFFKLFPKRTTRALETY